MTPTPKAIENAARAIYTATPRNRPYEQLSLYKKEILRAQATKVLTGDLGDMVLVPRDVLLYARQMANICFNLKQSSALELKTRKSLDEVQSAFDRAMVAAAEDSSCS